MTESPHPASDGEKPASGGERPAPGGERPTPGSTDAELIALIREHTPDSSIGRQAFAELYARHHDPALHYAIRLTGDRPRAEDAVAEAFAKIWRAWGNGAGPEESFKPYLMTAVRSESYRGTATTSATTAVVPEVLDVLAGSTSRDHASELAEREHLARAFSSLPGTWQTAITLIDIDGTPTAEAAESLDLSPNSFNSLLRRAREGLRTAYLQEHVEPARPACAAYSSELGRRRGESIETHLRHCQYCRRQTLLLGRINTKLGAWITPAVLAAALLESEQFPAVPHVAAMDADAEPTGAESAGAESAGAESAGAQNSETVFFSPGTGSGAAGSPSGLAVGLKIAAAALIATAAIVATVWALNPTPNAPEVEGPTSSPVQPETDLTDDDPGEDLRSPVAPPAAGSPDADVPAVPANEGPRNPAPAPPAPGEPGGPNAVPPGPRDPGPNDPGPNDPGPGDPGPGRPAPPPPSDPPPTTPPPSDPPPTEPPPTEPPTPSPTPTPTEPPPTSPPPTEPPPTEPPPTSPPPTEPPPTTPPPTEPPTPSPTPTEPDDDCHDLGWGWHCH